MQLDWISWDGKFAMIDEDSKGAIVCCSLSTKHVHNSSLINYRYSTGAIVCFFSPQHQMPKPKRPLPGLRARVTLGSCRRFLAENVQNQSIVRQGC